MDIGTGLIRCILRERETTLQTVLRKKDHILRQGTAAINCSTNMALRDAYVPSTLSKGITVIGSD